MLSDMTSMALDYSSKVNLVDGSSNASFDVASSSISVPQQPHNMPAPRVYKAFNPLNSVIHANGLQPGPSSLSDSETPRYGIGMHSRRPPERFLHDPSLTTPISFVKGSQDLESTMDKEEHDRLSSSF